LLNFFVQSKTKTTDAPRDHGQVELYYAERQEPEKKKARRADLVRKAFESVGCRVKWARGEVWHGECVDL
jgi:hypothetical protein